MIAATNAAEMPDALSTFISEVEESMAKLKKSLAETRSRAGAGRCRSPCRRDCRRA